jgi:hypothetical protein
MTTTGADQVTLTAGRSLAVLAELRGKITTIITEAGRVRPSQSKLEGMAHAASTTAGELAQVLSTIATQARGNV